MPRTSTKMNGNRFEKAFYHNLDYTTAFFNPGGDKSDDEKDGMVSYKVKLPIEISADSDDSRAFVTNFEMRGISPFNYNLKAVIKQKGIEDPNEEWKITPSPNFYKLFAIAIQYLRRCKKQHE